MAAKRVPKSKWEWHGYPGHLCVSNDCMFHMHTHVGDFCVSTVGHYISGSSRRQKRIEEMQPIGLDRTFETMVFRLLDDGEIDLRNLDFQGYNDAESARNGHMVMCRKWARGPG